jgi:hypothetical protein
MFREPVRVVVVVGVWLVAEVVADVPVGSETADSALGDVSTPRTPSAE